MLKLIDLKKRKNIINLVIIIGLISIISLISFHNYQFTSKIIFTVDDNIYLSIATNFLETGKFEIDYFTKNYPMYDFSLDKLFDQRPEISHTMNERGILYFLLLATAIKISDTTIENHYLTGAVLNSILSSFLAILFFFFIKRRFNLEIAIYSTALLITSPFFGWWSARSVPYPLLYLFVVSSLFFLGKTKKDYFIFGIFSGIALFTHPFAVIIPAGYISFLMYKKEFRGIGYVVLGFLLIMTCWFIYSSISGVDFDFDIIFPFATQIFSENSSTSINLNNNIKISTDVIDTSEVLFNGLSNLQALYALQWIGIFCFITLSISFAKNKMSLVIYLILTLLVAVILVFLNEFSLGISESIVIFLVIPISIFLICLKLKTTVVSREISILSISAFLGILAFFALNNLLNNDGTLYKILIFHSIFFLIPICFFGINKITSLNYLNLFPFKLITKFKFNPILFVIFVFLLGYSIINYNQTISAHEAYIESPTEIILNQKINELLPSGSSIASSHPESTALRTNNKVIPFPDLYSNTWSYPWSTENMVKFDSILNHYSISHIVLYKNANSNQPNYKLESVFHDYEVIYSKHGSSILKIKPLNTLKLVEDFDLFISKNDLLNIYQTIEKMYYINFLDNDLSRSSPEFSDIKIDIDKLIEQKSQNFNSQQITVDFFSHVSNNEFLKAFTMIKNVFFWNEVFSIYGHTTSPIDFKDKSQIKNIHDETDCPKIISFQNELLDELIPINVSYNIFHGFQDIMLQLITICYNTSDKYEDDVISIALKSLDNLILNRSNVPSDKIESYFDTLISLSSIFEENNDNREASQIYQKMLKIDRFNPDLWEKVGDKYVLLNEKNLAIYSYEQAVKYSSHPEEITLKFKNLKTGT